MLTGVLLSGFFFAHKIGQILLIHTERRDEGFTDVYQVVGQIFFASADKLTNAFDFEAIASKIVIDVHRAHLWDITAVSALDKVVMKYRRNGKLVEVVGLNEASATQVDKFAVHDKDGAELIIGH